MTQPVAGHQLGFRFGINSGDVVAGVIGQHKFSYDLWGDAVNTASRMESSAERGHVQVTEATRALIGDLFDCESRGPIDVKGKGEMRVWNVIGERRESAGPPEPHGGVIDGDVTPQPTRWTSL